MSAVTGASLQAAVGEALGRSGAGRVGAVVVGEAAGPVVDVDGGARFEANSVQKLYTTGAAMLELGPGYRYSTEVRAGGGWDGSGVVPGDLALVASGDPTFTTDDLHELCRGVAGRGIRRVAGCVVVDDTRYDRLRSVPGWARYYVPAFCGPLSAFVVDRNRPRRDRPYLAEPALGNGALIVDALACAGVVVEGPVRVGRAAAGPVVAEHRSAPMAHIVQWILLRSDSFAAELLVKELGAHHGVPTTAGGLDVMRSVAAGLGVGAGPSPAIDGSGLSVSTTDTPRRQVDWLRTLAGTPGGDRFLGCLPVAGVSGTLARRLRGGPAAGRVVAKTGTRRRTGTVNLAGRATLATGEGVWFSFVLGGADSQARALAALDAAVVAMMGG